ncbi:MAG: chemotaxis protein CheA, partial [Polyangiales bacterium]
QVETWKSVWEDLDTLAAATTTRSDIQETLQRLRTHLQALAQADGQPSNQVLPPQDVVAAPPKSKSDVSSTASATPPKAEAIAATPIEAPPPSSGRQETSAHHHANRTMRVEEKKIDEFLDYVGELIIVREMFANVGKRLRGNTALTHLSSEYQRALEAFTALSHDLQHSIMEVRKISVRTVLQKVPRIIRDLASGNDKEVKVELDGTEVAVDKSLLEGFEAPIMHMVRNAIDHGIETREVRVEAGKPVTGHITVSVHEMPDDVVFTIRDDGRGIDDEALRQKATAAGIIDGTTAAKLSRKESYELLFAPGLSTAKAVTEVSGRGVGMDVVKRNVTELGGRIDIESERGAGTTFSVHLPKTVTVQILDGFLVQVGRERYVLPLRSIHESFRPVRDEIHTVAEQGECIYRHGHIFPLVRVADLLCVKSEIIRPDESIIVSVDVKGGGLVGLMVDHVLGTQQIVLRDVDGIDTRPAPFSGGAVLGDGHVAMVVDVERLGELLA